MAQEELAKGSHMLCITGSHYWLVWHLWNVSSVSATLHPHPGLSGLSEPSWSWACSLHGPQNAQNGQIIVSSGFWHKLEVTFLAISGILRPQRLDLFQTQLELSSRWVQKVRWPSNQIPTTTDFLE